jgi:hypothetical protein
VGIEDKTRLYLNELLFGFVENFDILAQFEVNINLQRLLNRLVNFNRLLLILLGFLQGQYFDNLYNHNGFSY